MKDFKIGELVLFLSDDALPCVGIVSLIGDTNLTILTMPSYNPFSWPKEKFYTMEEVKKKLK